MSWEEQGDVLHELLSNGVIMTCHLKRTEHLKQCLYVVLGHRSHLVEEALIHVNWDELKEVLVKEREDLGNRNGYLQNIKGATSSHMLSWISA